MPIDRARACAGACAGGADAGERLVLDGVGRDAGLGGRALVRLVFLLVAEEVEGVPARRSSLMILYEF